MRPCMHLRVLLRSNTAGRWISSRQKRTPTTMGRGKLLNGVGGQGGLVCTEVPGCGAGGVGNKSRVGECGEAMWRCCR